MESVELESLEKEKEGLADSLWDHKQVAHESFQYYKSMMENVTNNGKTLKESHQGLMLR